MNDQELLAFVRDGKYEREERRQRNRAKIVRRKMLAKGGVKRCRWCRCLLTESTATLEHILPISHGGKSTKDNCTWACKRCNNERGRVSNPTAGHYKTA